MRLYYQPELIDAAEIAKWICRIQQPVDVADVER